MDKPIPKYSVPVNGRVMDRISGKISNLEKAPRIAAILHIQMKRVRIWNYGIILGR